MIKYKIIQFISSNQYVKFQITEQYFIRGEFFKDSSGYYHSSFIASNGLDNKYFDWLNISIDQINTVINAIEEYNKSTIDRMIS
jgi:hypothetical protein